MNAVSFLEKGVRIEQFGDMFVAWNPRTGALSALTATELVAFHLCAQSVVSDQSLHLFYCQAGCDTETAAREANDFVDRMTREGWRRCRPPLRKRQPLQAVYFTITRRCNLVCPYCYQGTMDRENKEMSVADATRVLDQIRVINPQCHIVLTGGEPFSHGRVFQIIDRIAERRFPLSILTNGTFITDAVARRLARCASLTRIQISLDGITEETNAITRGKHSLERTLKGIRCVIQHGLPFSLAPTLHEGNLHELCSIADFAVSNGGWITPNNLRVFPHDANDGSLKLTDDSLWKALCNLNNWLWGKFSVETLALRSSQQDRLRICTSDRVNARFVCGMGCELLDVDWNGDVYPCHLLKDDRLILGNVIEGSFSTAFERANEMGIRVESLEIERCSKCMFVSTCGGGCRAGAYYTYGSFHREDNLCEVIHKAQLQALKRGMSAPSQHGRRH